VSDKKHQSNSSEYHIRVDGKTLYWSSMLGRVEINEFLKLCKENPDCYVDIARVSTEILMNQGEYHSFQIHFESLKES